MQLRSAFSLLLLFLFFLVIPLLASEQTSQVRIDIKDRSAYLSVKSLHLDEVYHGDGFVDVFVTAAEIEEISALGLEYSVTHQDIVAFYQSRLEAEKMMGGYRTLSDIELVMDSISNENPLIVTPKWSIGQTLEGRDIYVMKISDNPSVDEDEAEIYYYAAIHAREVITPEVLIYYMRYLTDNYGTDPQVTYLIDNREMFFTLVHNPDGYYHNEFTDPGGGGYWRKNRRDNGDGTYGVDLNRNYGYEWGYDNDGSSPFTDDNTYRGTAPFSEPATQVVRDFIISHEFVLTISYHSYSNLFLWPWGYDYLLTPDNDIYEQLGDSVTAWNGYTPEPAHSLYPANGVTDDWGYGEQTLKNKNFAVTLEVGSSSDGFWPSPSRITPLVTENLQPNLFYARMAGGLYQLRRPERPEIYTLGVIASNTFEVSWHHSDSLNPALSYEVWQLQNPQRVIDDLEGAVNYWDDEGFTLTTSSSHSSSHSYFGGSANNLNNKLTALENISVVAGDSLKFWTWYDIEGDWDYAYVEVSDNGGASWQSIASSITTNSNPNGTNQGNGITGNSSGWIEAKFDLAAFVGSDLVVRFRYNTDGAVNDPGFYVDDIGPLDTFAENDLIAPAVTDTFLLLTSVADGEYYYRVRARDAENQYSLYSELEYANVQAGGCSWIIGDADNSSLVDVSDAVFIINYIFNGGPAPSPKSIGSADSDCSMSVSISDVVVIVAFIFNGGAEPGSACSCLDY